MENQRLFHKIIIALVIVSLAAAIAILNKFSVISGSELIVAQKLSIATDKTEYGTGKTVAIAVANNTKNTVVQQAISSAGAEAVMVKKFLGENYGIGLIEKFSGGSWTVVEPVWRCGGSCFAECKSDISIAADEVKIFKWNQKIIHCERSGKQETAEEVGPGRYRISSAVWDDAEEKNKIIYSNEFLIK